MTLQQELDSAIAQRDRIAPDAFTLAIRVAQTGLTDNATRWNNLNDEIDRLTAEIEGGEQ